MKSERPPAVENPCPKSWGEMAGDARRRFCEHCQLHVHNLSEMTAAERRRFLAADASVCVTYRTDADGRLLSARDLPGFARWIERLRGAFVTLAATILPLGFASCANGQVPGQTTGKPLPPPKSAPTPSPSPSATPAVPAPTPVITGMIGPPKSR